MQYLTKFENYGDLNDSFINDFIKNDQNIGDLYLKFVRRLIKHIAIDYRLKEDTSVFSEIFHNSFNFIKTRTFEKRKIQSSLSKNKKYLDFLILSNQNNFLVDSIYSLITRLKLNYTLFFHPLIMSYRDENGNLCDIAMEDAKISGMLSSKTRGIKEIFIFVRFRFDFLEKKKNVIEKAFLETIDLVDEANELWKPVSKGVKEIIKSFELNSMSKNQKRVIEFLRWLNKDNFTFLGLMKFSHEKEITKDISIKQIKEVKREDLEHLIEFSERDKYSKDIMFLGKINLISYVHRNTFLEYILVKNFNQDKDDCYGWIILGLYTSSMYFGHMSTIPILKDAIVEVVHDLGFTLDGYSAKKVSNIIELIPRDALLQIRRNKLRYISEHILSGMNNNLLKLFIYEDWCKNFTNIIVFMHIDQLTPEAYNNVIKYLSQQFGMNLQIHSMDVVIEKFILLFIIFPSSLISKKPKLSVDKIEKGLISTTTNWIGQVKQEIFNRYKYEEGVLLYEMVSKIFNVEYRLKFSPKVSLEDVIFLQKASITSKRFFNLIKEQNRFSLKIYSSERYIILSELVPLIENIGFDILDEQSFLINSFESFKQSWIFFFNIRPRSNNKIIISKFDFLKQNIQEALVKMDEGLLKIDTLNQLILFVGFKWGEVFLINAFVSYLNQTDISYSSTYIKSVLIKHYSFALTLVNFFYSKFQYKYDNRQKFQAKFEEEILLYLENVQTTSEDKVLRGVYLLIVAMNRSNYFHTHVQKNMEYISFKLDSKKIPNLPRPIPYSEIFVYSNKFEAVHLRGGAVSRGGIRWSDRGEDYRLEALGLMRAQITKNVVIVPTGAKGAFFIKTPESYFESKDLYMEHVVSCYQNFLRAMLDITDNIENNKIISPAHSIIYDQQDPYLVVAADKGTSNFSDYANSISNEYNFWLGDAFASGGSVGYDHKKMAITAKGAFVSLRHHMYSRGNDISSALSVVGIGDMSGDVFGNGILLFGSNIRLVAAFNHNFIFIDPNPDPQVSFRERKRLFHLKKGNWNEYNTDLLSEGGKIFNRSCKEITLSKTIRELVGVHEHKISPEKLINSILKMNVDLIWNGGIGTYVKSSLESNQDIGDKANDSLRCNGFEIQSSMFIEGGNLGASQLGRIEYARYGGGVNTDFIDNSAGVDCSDHEVNIKIVLNNALKNNKISFESRNQILFDMSSSLEELVLKNNHEQNQAINIAQNSHLINHELIEQLIVLLEKNNILDRNFEFLPSRKELVRRSMNQENFTKPELAILLSYSKLYLREKLKDAQLTGSKIFDEYLLKYFPEQMQENFKEEIISHPLRKEMLNSILTNKLINKMHGALVVNIQKETGVKICDIMRAYVVISEIVGLEELWQKISSMIEIKFHVQMSMFSRVINVLKRAINWMLKYSQFPINIENKIQSYGQDRVDDLTKIISDLLIGTRAEKYAELIKFYEENFVQIKTAQKVVYLDVLVSVFDILHISNNSKLDNLKEIAKLYFYIGEEFYFDLLRELLEKQLNGQYWNKLSVQSIKDDLYDKQKRIVSFVANLYKSQSKKEQFFIESIRFLREKKNSYPVFQNFIDDIKSQDNITIHMLILANKKIESFIKIL